MKPLIGVLAHQLKSDVVRRIFQQEWSDAAGFDVLCCWGNDRAPDESRFAAVTRKYQELQRMFLAGSWSHLLAVEQDMLIPPDALGRLARLARDGADVAYGLYCWRYTDQMWWSAHPKLRVDEETPYFWSLTHAPDDARAYWGQPIVVEGLGLGCTLISRDALARLPFRQRSADHSCDTAFALDARADGLTQVADLGVVCGHYIGDGQVVWPDPDADDLYRIEEAP